MPEASPDDALAVGAAGPGLCAALEAIPALAGTLGACKSVSELFSCGAAAAAGLCGFTRGVVLGVSGDVFDVAATGPLDNDLSDALRRSVLARPIPVTPGTPEAVVLMPVSESTSRRHPLASVVARELALEHYAYGLIRPDRGASALLVLDRPGPSVTSVERALVSAIAGVISASLAHVVLHMRLAELSRELRHFAVSSQAMLTEAVEAPVTALPSSWGRDVVFPGVRATQAATRGGESELLSDREAEVMALLILGRSNREIAHELVIALDTAKSRVASIMRKLGATNRVDAVSRYLTSQQDDPATAR